MNNIVILGSGFAGLRCALKLERQLERSKLYGEWSVILIDKNSYHTYTPALYEAASAYIWTGAGQGEKQDFEEMLGGSLCLPVQEIIRDKNIVFIHQGIVDIDFAADTVCTKAGGAVPFKYLVLALGSESIYFDVKGAETCCYGLKTLYDALRIRRRIEKVFTNFSDGEIRIAVVGGGATGVETIAEIAKYAKHLACDFKLDYSKVKILLLEAQDKILTDAGDAQRTVIEKRLKRLGVEIRTGARISEVEKSCVILSGGEKCFSDITIWAAGVKGPTLFSKFSKLEKDKRGRVAVNEFLQVKGFTDIFAIGDNALFIDEKNNPTPPTAFIAEQQADLVAENIIHAMQGKYLAKYRMSVPGYVLSCGGKYAVVQFSGMTFSGFPGWMIKRFIDLKYFFSILPFFKAYSLWLHELRMFTKND